jgi:glutamyl-tRNA synthetase
VSHTGRFAPSPSGPLHEGNLRTALVAWLRARSQGARFLLRIEDLDPQRSKPEHEASQIADLRAVGVDWDEEPVRQSERHGLYAEALSQLEHQGRVYPCWCTRAEIREAAQAPHGPLPEGAYPGTCRGLSAKQRAERERTAQRPPALRLDAQAETIAFTDLLHGRVESAVDDIVLRRFDGAWAYNVAVIVDDADQAIGEVVRGDDLLDTTPRQLLIARLLSLPEPAYAHVPLVLDEDGKRLAKRNEPELRPEAIMRIADGAAEIARRLEAPGGQPDH